jgi:hypothetical protein
MAAPHSPNQNYLLAALPPKDFEVLVAHLELVPMPLGEFLYEPSTQLQYAYFPTAAIVSLHYVMESGASAETAGVGYEGMVGISLFMGGDTTPSSAVAQTAGPCVPAGQKSADTRIQSRRYSAKIVAALYPGTDHTDGTDRSL